MTIKWYISPQKKSIRILEKTILLIRIAVMPSPKELLLKIPNRWDATTRQEDLNKIGFPGRGGTMISARRN